MSRLSKLDKQFNEDKQRQIKVSWISGPITLKLTLPHLKTFLPQFIFKKQNFLFQFWAPRVHRISIFSNSYCHDDLILEATGE